MPVKFKNFTFNESVISNIEQKCRTVGAHDFNSYLHECSFGGKPIIDTIKMLKSI